MPTKNLLSLTKPTTENLDTNTNGNTKTNTNTCGNNKVNILIGNKLFTLTQSLRIRHKYSNAIKSFDSDLGFLISKECSIACREKILVTFQPIAFSAK